jgi:large subunit ribosomal protein L46
MMMELMVGKENSGVMSLLNKSVSLVGGWGGAATKNGIHVAPKIAAGARVCDSRGYASSIIGDHNHNNVAAASSGQYASACALERLPVVMPERPAWEVEYKKWQAEFHAKRYKILPAKFTDDAKAAEEEESSVKAGWKPASRETRADREGDRRTLKRRLDQRLFLLLKRRGGKWGFAQSEIQQGDTSRSAAERALKDAVGEEGYQHYFIGNGPAAHTASGTDDDETRLVFYHRCQLIQGLPKIQGEYEDYAWVAPDEFGEYFEDAAVVETLQKMA